VSFAQLTFAIKGSASSGNYGHAGIPGKVGGSAADTRVWSGTQQASAQELSNEAAGYAKLNTGQVGEKLAMKVLSEKFGVPFETLNVGKTNAPIDVVGNSSAVEVKTGLATNGPTAQHWRAMISKPSKKEQELIAKMTKEEKKELNRYKDQQTLERKHAMLDKMTEIAGTKIKPITVGIILSADGKKGDVFIIPGFHNRLKWAEHAVDANYAGTYDVE
jgi:hypothetical protein